MRQKLVLQSQFNSVQLLSRVQLIATPWTAALQASLSITDSQRLLKLMSIELVMPSNHLILCCLLQSFPASGSFQMGQLFASGGQSIGVSASKSVLPMNLFIIAKTLMEQRYSSVSEWISCGISRQWNIIHSKNENELPIHEKT